MLVSALNVNILATQANATSICKDHLFVEGTLTKIVNSITLQIPTWSYILTRHKEFDAYCRKRFKRWNRLFD
jgi:hypothetical protein